MKKKMILALALGTLTGLAVRAQGPGPSEAWRANAAAFRSELDALREPLGIPGLAFVVVRDGQVLAKEGLGRSEEAPFTSATPLRIASVTKALTALLALQQIDAGALSLEAPVKRYLPEFDGPDDVLLRHLLSHTSEGRVGTEYVYSSTRYAQVGQLLQAAAGQPFESLLRKGVLEPAGMRFYDSPHLGAHAGLVSTVDEMAKLLLALEAGRVVGPASQARLEAPARGLDGRPQPVGLGWFTQEVQGQRVVWSFGQDDPEHSGALLLRVPARRCALFVLANRNTLSDPFRLLMGDVRKSPVAGSFLRNFVSSPAGRPIAALGDGSAAQILARVAAEEARGPYRYTDELLARAMTRQWAGDSKGAEALFFPTLDRYDLRQVPDPVLHFLAVTLGTPASRSWGIAQGERLLESHRRNRWVLFAQANLLASEPGRAREAVGHYQAILDLPQQAPDFLNRLFRGWCLTAIAQLVRGSEPAQAERRLEQVIALKIGGETEAAARRLLDEWRAPTRP